MNGGKKVMKEEENGGDDRGLREEKRVKKNKMIMED